MNNILFAFLLTLFAGLATGIGSALAFFTKKTNKTFLASSLGFSAGVMIYVSFVEIFFKGLTVLKGVYPYKKAYIITTFAFFSGIIIIALIDKLVPSFENPHETRAIEELNDFKKVEENLDKMEKQNKSKDSEKFAQDHKLYRMGIFSAIAIAIHNFPEGLATFASALKDPTIGISIAIAISIHNIHEGIAISIPLYYATGNRKKAFFFSFLSGLSEPVGALIGYLLLKPFFNDIIFGILFSFVAGIMVFISLDELLPSAEKYGKHHIAIYSLIGGMAIMAISLLLFS